MSLLTQAIEGALKGYDNYLAPSERFDGVPPFEGSVAFGLIVTAIGIRALYGDIDFSVYILTFAGSSVGLLKGTEGSGINFTSDPQVNRFVSIMTKGVIALGLGGAIVKEINPSMIRLELVTLVAGCAGAIFGGALKKVVEG